MKIHLLLRPYCHFFLALIGILATSFSFGCSAEAPSPEASALQEELSDQTAEALETSAALATPTWTPAGSLSTARDHHTATLLQSGRVLITGGYDGGSDYLASAELYDPATNTSTATGAMSTMRWAHTATLLQNGKVLIAGSDDGLESVASPELYDPATNRFTPAGATSTMHWSHTATLLQNGKVLIAGGYNYDELASAELYDPATNRFTPAGATSILRWAHTATLLQNGKVLIAGGRAPAESLASAELYDPATNTFSPAGSMGTRRVEHIATLLPNGKVLITGGYDDRFEFLASAELYDPATNTFSPTASMLSVRYQHTSTLLPNGKVLVAGGNDGFEFLANAELYDPATNTFTSTTSMNTARIAFSATLLQSGQVLAAGGFTNGGRFIAGAELYSLGGSTGGAACTSSSDCGSGFCVDGVCCNTACGGGDPNDCQACSVTAGAASNGTCQLRSAGASCQSAEGTCGVPGACSGASTACVPDAATATLASAQLFVDNVTDVPFIADTPDTNTWGTSGSIDWVHFTGVTQGASLFTLSLQHANPTLTDLVLKRYWGTKRPNSVDYYDLVVAQNHFARVTNIGDVKPGDLLAIDYRNAERTGHAAIIEDCPTPIEAPPTPVVASTTQYELHVIDAINVAHGCRTDSRWVPSDPSRPCSGGTTDAGAGRGTMRLYVTSAGLPGAGTIVGHAWSLTSGTTYYSESMRRSAIGRFVP